MDEKLHKELEKVWAVLDRNKNDPDYSKFYPLWRDLGTLLGKHNL